MKKIFLICCMIFFVKLGYSQKKFDTIHIVCKDKNFNDSAFSYSKYNLVYKERSNILYISTKKKIKIQAAKKLWENKRFYIIITYKCSKGEKIEEGFWHKESLKDGIYRHYHENGQLKSEGVYFDNSKVGLWKYYDRNGILIKTENHQSNIDIPGTNVRYPILK